MKRRESFKAQTTNDLATFSLTSNLSGSLTENSNINNTQTALLTNNNNNTTSINATIINSKLKLKEICIAMPVAKPTLNELKPQLSIENKQIKTAKSLIER
jgi:hypothetical protein